MVIEDEKVIERMLKIVNRKEQHCLNQWYGPIFYSKLYICLTFSIEIAIIIWDYILQSKFREIISKPSLLLFVPWIMFFTIRFIKAIIKFFAAMHVGTLILKKNEKIFKK